jgi:hypothetical protein
MIFLLNIGLLLKRNLTHFVAYFINNIHHLTNNDLGLAGRFCYDVDL